MAPGTMRAVVVDAPGSFGVSSRPVPAANGSDLLVRVRGVGLCGTDMHLLEGALPYDSFPLVPGHEFYGEVVAVGDRADPARIGRLVAVDPNLPCLGCSECRRGRPNLCSNYQALGVTRDGAAAEIVRVPSHLAYDLPDDVSDAAALLVEPLACAIHGMDRLPRDLADRYLVYGAGTMGLLFSLLAAEMSTGTVTVVEPNATRREVAVSCGLEAVADAGQLTPGMRWDSVIDCTGVVSAIEDGLTRVRPGGVLQCFGVASAEAVATFRPFDIYRNEITILGSMAIQHSFDRAVRTAQDWGDRLTPLVTHSFPLEDYAEAVETFRSGAGIKIALRPNGHEH